MGLLITVLGSLAGKLSHGVAAIGEATEAEYGVLLHASNRA
jgi:hypothetical protein